MTRPILRLFGGGKLVCFWIDKHGEVVGWDDWLPGQTVTAEEGRDAGLGWDATDANVAHLGTTLASIRDQLLEMEKGQ